MLFSFIQCSKFQKSTYVLHALHNITTTTVVSQVVTKELLSQLKEVDTLARPLVLMLPQTVRYFAIFCVYGVYLELNIH